MRAPEADSLWAVEAWRGVAALLVLATHWAPLAGGHNALTAFGFTGVNLFFVISGFVFAPHALGLQPLALGPYAVRRLMRIYPAYLVALALYAGLKAAQGQPLPYLLEHVLMLHVQNREMAFHYSPPFWSLPAEASFYAAVPLLALMSRQPWARMGWVLLAMAAAGLRLACLGQADEPQQNLAYVLMHHLPTLLVEFLLGVAAWRMLQTRAGTVRSRWMVGGLGLMGYLAAMVLYGQLQARWGHDWRHGQTGLLAAASFALLLWSTARLQPPPGLARTLGDWAGRLSYGVYLLHPLWGLAVAALLPTLGAAGAVGLGLLGLGLSTWALHRAVEAPARAWGRRWSAQKTSVSPG